MNQKTQKREFPYVKLILIVTLVLVVAIVGYSIVDSIGLIAQVTTAGRSDNYKLNENIVDVYRYTSGQQEFTYYYQYLSMYLSLYGSSSDINSIASMINNMDPMGGTFMQYMLAGKSGMDYVYDHIAHYNPLGRFDANAYSTLRQVLTYCEGARDDGDLYNTYLEEAKEDVDAAIDDMKETAKLLGVTFATFRSRYMGDGVSEKDIRKALELQYIAGQYAEKLNEEFMYDKTTVEDAEKYRDEHKESFYISSYFSINLYGNELYEDVKDCKTLDEVATAIAKFYFEKNYDEQYKKYFQVKDAEVEDTDKDKTKADILTTVLAMNGLTEEKEVFTAADASGKDAYKQAARKVATGINTSTSTNKVSLKNEVEKITKRADKTPTETAYVDLSKTPESGTSYSDLQKWLFKTDRKTDDFEAIKSTSTSTSTSTTTTTTYTFYIAKDICKWDTDKAVEFTKDVFYVKLTDDATEAGTGEGETAPVDPKTAVEKAQILYDALKDIKDKDEFAEKLYELLEKYQPSSTSSATIKEMVTESSLTDANLKAWVYNPLRKPGDIAILPLSEEDKKLEDAAADKENEKETEVEAGTETDAVTEAETEAETKGETETTGSTTEKKDDVYLAFFVEENKATWEENARTEIASEKLNDWFEAALEKYHVDVNYEFETEHDHDHESEAETSAETKAETKAETEAATKAETEAA